MVKYCLYIKYLVTEDTPHSGYCSDVDVEEITKVEYRKTENREDPDKDFVRSYCEENGRVNEEGLIRLSYEKPILSVWCNCGLKIVYTATSARLKKVNNVRDEYLEEDSEDE
jgi:hypothetical protein